MVFSKRCYYICFWQVINCGNGCSSRAFCAMKLCVSGGLVVVNGCVGFVLRLHNIIFYRHYYVAGIYICELRIVYNCTTPMKTILILQDRIILYKTFNWVDLNIRQATIRLACDVKVGTRGSSRWWNPTKVHWIRTRSDFSSTIRCVS